MSPRPASNPANQERSRVQPGHHVGLIGRLLTNSCPTSLFGVSELARRRVGVFFPPSRELQPPSSCTPRAHAVLSPARPCLVWQGAGITTSSGHWALALIDRLCDGGPSCRPTVPCATTDTTSYVAPRHPNAARRPPQTGLRPRPRGATGQSWPCIVFDAQTLDLHMAASASLLCYPPTHQGEKIANSFFMQLSGNLWSRAKKDRILGELASGL